jgi:hypothetical protein
MRKSKISIHAPTRFVPFKSSIALHAPMEIEHLRRCISRVGKLRDQASGDVREALNDALRLLVQPRRFTSRELGEWTTLPKPEPKMKANHV